jgi:heptosyltransferase III
MKVLVVPCRGIGDALLMMTASHLLGEAGFEVTTCHPSLKELKAWFPRGRFLDDLPSDLAVYDLVVIQNDHSPRTQRLVASSQIKKRVLFYPSYSPDRHPSLSIHDQPFCEELSMVDNIALATARLLSIPCPKKITNGITPPSDLIYQKEPNRVVIHPLSSDPRKNWSRRSYLKVAKKLSQRGYKPCFAIGPQERREWVEREWPLPELPTLDALARLLYESGYAIGNDSLIGHLASNLAIPTLIIADDAQRMRLWRPGWRKGEVITPLWWIPNIKGLRLRKRFWKLFISVRQLLLAFGRL